jgi:hypothetical protein
MKYFTARRCRNFAIFAILAALVLVLDRLMATALRDAAPASGWLLLGMVVLLAAYNVRKKLPFLPLGSSSSWLQLHIYVGLLAIVVFGAHVNWSRPGGVFDVVLASLFSLVCLSGVVGLIVSRVFALRMTGRGPEVFYERIARLRNRLRHEVEQLVLECLGVTDSTAIHEFYTDRLQSFFAAPRNFFLHLLQSRRPRRALLAEIDAQRRFLNDAEQQFMQRIASRVETKDDLDFQHAHQSVLKYWLFVHIPLTYALLVFAVIHGMLVHAFRG